MHQDLTEIAFILDRSGSMQSIAGAAIEGFNDFLREQQHAPGHARLSLVLFNDRPELHCSSIPIAEVTALNSETYVPHSSTALLDAVGRTIDNLGQMFADRPEHERPAQVVVAILTDGLENASKHYTIEQIQRRIQHQKDVYSWKFLFLGANQDAIESAAQIGISAHDSATYRADDVGQKAVSKSISQRVASYRDTKNRADSSATESSLESLYREKDNRS